MVDTGDDRRTMRSRAVLISVKWNVAPRTIFKSVTIVSIFHVSKIRRILKKNG
jgi:hypothetical protein